MGSGSGSVASPPIIGDSVTCTVQPFATSTPLHEASGAAWMTIDGTLSLVVISDSGNNGEYAIIDPESGVTTELGKLPLGGPGEDLEGVAIRDNKLVAVTSAGWVRVWQREGKGFTLVEGPYPLGPVDLPPGGAGNMPPKGEGMVCDGKQANCGRNYEGLCLAPDPTNSRCIGFVAGKADGHLFCVVDKEGKLVAEYAGSIPIAQPGAVADCAFSPDGKLYVGSNFFDIGNVYRVDGWRDPSTAKVTKLGALAIGFPETLAVRGDIIYRMSDTGGSPSLMAKYRCTSKRP